MDVLNLNTSAYVLKINITFFNIIAVLPLRHDVTMFGIRGQVLTAFIPDNCCDRCITTLITNGFLNDFFLHRLMMLNWQNIKHEGHIVHKVHITIFKSTGIGNSFNVISDPLG